MFHILSKLAAAAVLAGFVAACATPAMSPAPAPLDPPIVRKG